MQKNLDQFYTKQMIAHECVSDLLREVGSFDTWDSFIEPSAGSGAFLRLLPVKAVGVDLDPKDVNIIKADYLSWNPSKTAGRSLVIGNPPFGKNSSLAVKFFNRSACFADTIAFILPRTFRKSSVVNRLHTRFHLVYERVLPTDSFITPEGDSRSIPTCFQIWRRRLYDRPIVPRAQNNHPDWDWVTSVESATHAVRRVGAAAGKLIQLSSSPSPASHFFIRSKVEDLDTRWESVWTRYWCVENDLNSKWDVAGNPSLTKEEIVSYYDLALTTS